MNMPQDGIDELNPRKAGVAELQRELANCTSRGPNGWDRLSDNDRVRLNIWDNQTTDCKKHDVQDSPALPFDGASDLRVFTADGIINENVDVMTLALDRAFLTAHGSHPSDVGVGASMTKVLRWYVDNRQNVEINSQKQQAANYMESYGWAALQVTWEREITMRLRPIKLDKLLQAVLQTQGEEAAMEVALLVKDPLREGEAIGHLQTIYNEFLQTEFSDLPDFRPRPLSPRRAAEAVRDLREDGVASLPVPALTKNQPCIRALCPWRDIFIPTDLSDLQRGRVYIREFYTSAELHAKVITAGWNKTWVKKAIETQGKTTVWQDESTWAMTYDMDPESVLIEVWTAYTWRIDADCVPGIYVTVFSAFFNADPESSRNDDLSAMHGLLDYEHGKIPMVATKREEILRTLGSSRGTPEVAWPMQRVEKVTFDSTIDRTSLTTLPPMLMDPRDIALGFKFAPLVGLPFRAGRQKPEPLSLPRFDSAVPDVMDRAKRMTDDYWSRMTPDVMPVKAQARQARMVKNFLTAWEEAFQQEMALILQYCPESTWEKITGEPKPELSPEDIAGEFRLHLSIDVRELDIEHTTKQLEVISNFVVPADVAGVIDRSKLTFLQLQAINPVLAQQLVSDAASANQKLFNQVNMDIAMMALGNPPQMVEMDPTAQTKLQFAAQIIQANPNYQQALSSDGRFKELLDAYAKNLSQSVIQEQNKTTGRLGVDPKQLQAQNGL